MALNAVIGSLRVNLGMNSAAFTKGATEAEKRLKTMQKRIAKTGENFQRLGTRLSVGLTLPIAALATKSVAAAKRQEQAVAAVDAALKSMGTTAGFTSTELQKMASGLQGNSLFGDEEILERVTANLLTFGKVQGEVFERAQQAALDLSARLGTDLQSSTLQLGKALNDPIKGVSALTEVGVSFTEQQREQIKAMTEAGDVAGAQTVILDELSKQYSGQAKALAETDSGKITQSLNRIGDAFEKIGVVLLPVLADLAEFAGDLADKFSALSPETQKFVVVGGALAAALGPIAISLGVVVSAISAFLPLIVAVVSPVGLAAAALTGLGIAAYQLYQNWDDVVASLRDLGGRLKERAVEAADSFRSGIESIVSFTSDVFGRLGDVFSSDLNLAEKVRAAAQVILDAHINVFGGITDLTKGILENLGQAIRAGIIAIGGDAGREAIRLVDKFIEGLKDIVRRTGEILDDLKDAIKAKIKGLGKDMLQAGKDVAAGLGNGIKNGARNVAGAAKDMASGAADAAKDLLGIQSPSRVFMEIGGDVADGLAIGITDGTSKVEQAARDLGQAAASAIRDTMDGVFDGLISGGGIKGAFNDIVSRGQSAFGDLLSGAFSGGGFSSIFSGIGSSITATGKAIGSIFTGGGLGAIGSALTSALPVIGLVSTVFKGLIGSKKITGQGFDLGVSGGDITGGQFKTTKTKRLFGLIKKTRTKTTPFDDEVLFALQQEVAGIQDGVAGVFERLGVDVTDAAINSVNLAVTRFDTRGLSEAEIEAKFSEIFGAYAEALSQSLGNISVEAASILAEATDILRPAGQMFFGSLEQMAVAAGDLVSRTGGLGGLASGVSQFANLFFTEAEKLAVLEGNVASVFDALNLAIPETIKGFKELVLSQNLMTEAGRETYAALLAIAPQFDAITKSTSDFGLFDLSQKRFATLAEEQLFQIAQARDYDVAQTEQLVTAAVLSPNGESPASLLERVSETLENIERLGIPERT